MEIGDLKGKIGSQRYGFVLLLGFYITLFGGDIFKPTIKQQIMRFIVFIVIFCGIFLTYSKTTIVALVASLLIFLVLNIKIFTVFKNFTFKRAIYILSIILCVFIAIYAFIVMYLDVLLHVLSFDVNDSETSLGFRIYMFDLVMQFIAENPIFGSNYQGIYLLYDQLDGGSVHNQFLDMLLRVGIVGFIIWVYVIFKVLMSIKVDNALFYGMISIIIFGLMHETFKLAWGGFIFGMLLSFSYSSVFKLKEEGV
jgi:O-antigen ligase